MVNTPVVEAQEEVSFRRLAENMADRSTLIPKRRLCWLWTARHLAWDLISEAVCAFQLPTVVYTRSSLLRTGSVVTAQEVRKVLRLLGLWRSF